MSLIKFLLLTTALLNIYNKTGAQDTTRIAGSDATLMSQLETQEAKNETNYAAATFKYTHVIDGQSVENLPARVLDVRILHRFGPLSSGLYNFFGLDYSPFNVKIGFEYGITNNFMIGVAHSGYNKTYDAFFKLRLLRQSTGAIKSPVTVSFASTVAISTLKPSQIDPAVKPDPTTKIDRASYVLQLLAARKFSEGFALQLMPTFVHADNISFLHNKHDIFAIGIAGRQKLSKRINFNAEYYYQLPDMKAPGAHNVLSFGINIGTGGHVFELLFSNSFGLTEKQFITETPGRWDNADALFGFNISRVFQLGKKHK
ncbi:hypothetical protein FW778_16095 [Ginsengibacter hankyongi]|uniref:DUF5777 domain-containing protein n=1 Tax=Ginsengibacter hankyongi TaxID=2607284 RepID=A0A5J5IHV5_9BACT|nr:DUF5777 family beta-barrel protein [Ginsengibacter hankyongi]KAA9037614.1 hypothetical protein FW778_16095 [Ginsengibacter hankyongi]